MGSTTGRIGWPSAGRSQGWLRRRLASLGTPQKLGEPVLEFANGNLHGGMAMWPSLGAFAATYLGWEALRSGALRSAVVVTADQDHKRGPLQADDEPIPTNPSRRQAWISWLIRFSCLRS